MTRKDAERIIARIRGDKIQLHISVHAREQFAKRNYSPHDLRAILRSYELEFAPEWSEKHLDFKVSLRGKCLDGRPTRVVLGLRADGPCILVTIMVIREDVGRTT